MSITKLHCQSSRYYMATTIWSRVLFSTSPLVHFWIRHSFHLKNRSDTHWNSPGRQVCHALKQGCIWSNMVEAMMCGLASPFIGEIMQFPILPWHCRMPLFGAICSLSASDHLPLNIAGCLSWTMTCTLRRRKLTSGISRCKVSLSGTASGSEPPLLVQFAILTCQCHLNFYST